MTGKTHLLAGVLSIIPAVVVGEPGLFVIPGCIIGSVLPDLDAEYSTFNTWMPGLAKAYKLLPTNAWTKHRGALLHSVFTLLILLGLMVLCDPMGLVSGILWGVISHHLLDLLSPKGLDYLYIFRRKGK
jgi:membrane-bound metal-dependent hydrolase YbcI (DUF457 family)